MLDSSAISKDAPTKRDGWLEFDGRIFLSEQERATEAREMCGLRQARYTLQSATRGIGI
jgi:hypothetical protein